nr:unnamed protein product [Digitaria exilis]
MGKYCWPCRPPVRRNAPEGHQAVGARNQAEQASRGRLGGVPDADHLSALPDAPLLYIMSFPKAWEVVRTCVLSRRWRHLWKSVPCIDIRLRTGDYIDMPQGFTDFVHHLFCRRDASAKLDTLHLRSSDLGCAHNEGDARACALTSVNVGPPRNAIKQGARVIHFVGHRNGDWFSGMSPARLGNASFVSCHLKDLEAVLCPGR